MLIKYIKEICITFTAAGLSVRSIFKFQSYKRSGEMNAYIKKLSWADGSGSDLIAILNAYRVSRNEYCLLININ